MKTIITGVSMLMLLASAANAQEKEKKKDDTLDKAGQIAIQPVRDIGLDKEEIAKLLQDALENPYAPPTSRTCKGLNKDMDELNAILGPDFTVGKDANENRVGKVAEAVGKAVVNSLIPFRGLVREISGAAPAERRLRAAVAAGMARRGYLRGMAVTKGCKIKS